MSAGRNNVAEQVRRLWQSGKRNEAKLVCKLAIDGESVTVRELVVLGQLMAKMNCHRAAQSAASRACKLAPKHVAAWTLHAESSLRLRRPENAISSAKHALANDPSCSQAWRVYMLALAYSGDSGDAEQFVPAVMARDPQAVHTLCQAVEYVRKSIIGKSATTKDAVHLQLPHIHAMVQRVMGIGLLATGFLSEARRRFNLSLELEGDDEVSWRRKALAEYRLAIASYEKGCNNKNVCELFESALQVDYQNQEVANALRELLSIPDDRRNGSGKQDSRALQSVAAYNSQRKTIALRERVLKLYLEALYQRLLLCWNTIPLSYSSYFQTQKLHLVWAVKNISVALPKHSDTDIYRKELDRLHARMRKLLPTLQFSFQEIRQTESSAVDLSTYYLDKGAACLQMDCVPLDDLQSLRETLEPRVQRWLARGLWHEDIMGRSRLFKSRPCVFQLSEFWERLDDAHDIKEVVCVREAIYQRPCEGEPCTETDPANRCLLRCATKSFLLSIRYDASSDCSN